MWTLCQVSSAAEPKTIGEYLLRCRFYDACFHVMENRRLSQTTPRMAPAPIEIPLNSVGRIDVPWETFVNLRIKARKPPRGDFRVWICLKSFGKEVCADWAGCAVHFPERCILETAGIAQKFNGWCRWWDLNPHGFLRPQDFKSCASAISPHRHPLICNHLQLPTCREFDFVLVIVLVMGCETASNGD